MKKQFNKVYISLGTRPYVYYYIYKNGKKERVRVYGNIRKGTEQSEIGRALTELKDQTQTLINSGIYDLQPFSSRELIGESIGILIKKVISDKQKYLSQMSHGSHSSHLNNFAEFLAQRNLLISSPGAIKQSTIVEYRLWLLNKGVSNRTVNNILIDVRAFFNYLFSKIEDYNYKNPCLGIDRLRTRSETHVRYTQGEAEKISEYLKTYDPTLYLFCQFITYTFLRPNEIRLLKINQIDLQQGVILRTAANHKTGKRKIQILQKIFHPKLKELQLEKYPTDFFIFGSDHRPGEKCFGHFYFTKRFKKCKLALDLSAKQTMYGLKHTFISHLKTNGASDEELMGVTGHETREALYKYLRDIGAADPKDLSELYTFAF